MLTNPAFLWLALLVGFLLIEGCSPALVSIWFSAGAAAALLLQLLGCSFTVQVIAFVVVSAALLAALRPMLRKHVKRTKTNVDSIIGAPGLVTEAIDNVTCTGRVQIASMTWSARSTPGNPIPAGTQVTVDRIEGVKVFVSPVNVTETV